MSGSDRRELAHRLELLLAHLLKYQCLPHLRARSWLLTVHEQRRRIRELVQATPGLQPQLHDPEQLARAYDGAARTVARESQLARRRFPDSCPFSLEQALDDGFLP